VFYNQPKFCESALWNPNATTLANESTVGLYPSDIFINIYNTVYVAVYWYNRVLVWPEGSSIPTRNITGNLNGPYSVFVTHNGDVYVDNGAKGRIRKWSPNATRSTIVMYVDSECSGLFIDINNTLYCSQWINNVIVKGSLDKDANTSMIAAGNGYAGSTSNLLFSPIGIFVDINFNLYVADAGNNRIQLFRFDHLDAITVAGDGASINFALNYPTGVVLDADGYLFIVDDKNDRVVRWGPNGVRCLVGCSNGYGSGSDQLSFPWALAFDSYGNLFVTDWRNGRIQKFSFISKSCGKFDH
ncbi:unnamed protein product, partial [Rotaria sordida]